MRQIINPQRELEEVRIEAIKLDLKCRDEFPVLLRGLQYPYADEETRARLFALLEDQVLPATINQNTGRPGMELWRIQVMALLKQGLGIDYDRLHDLVNQHMTIREFLGHGSFSNKDQYQLETVIRNVTLLSPELLSQIGQWVVESGHRISDKKVGEPLRARCDSFVVETDVHYPTDTHLLWDSMRCLIREVAKISEKQGVDGWRQWKYLTKCVKNLFNQVRRSRQSNANLEKVKAYLRICEKQVKRAEKTLSELLGKEGVSEEVVKPIQRFIDHARRQMDQVERRLIHGEVIPHAEKVFSIFEPHTRWVSKGKAGRPVELGVPVCIIEDEYGFIVHHEVLWEGGDVDIAVPMIESAQAKHPDRNQCRFDRGFHSPENRIKRDGLLDHNTLPRKGRWSKADKERESADTFKKARKPHPAIESAINNLEHRSLDRVRSYGADGFERMVSISILAFNVHRLGLILCTQEQEKLRRQKWRRAA